MSVFRVVLLAQTLKSIGGADVASPFADASGGVASEHAGVQTPCECDWDNKWLYLLDDLLRVFSLGFAEQAEAAPSRANRSRALGSSDTIEILEELVLRDGICRAEPNKLSGSKYSPLRLDETMLARVATNPLYADSMGDLCLPGQLALNLLCSQYFAIAVYTGRVSHFPGTMRGGRSARRVSKLLPLVSGCLESSPWPLNLSALGAYLLEWDSLLWYTLIRDSSDPVRMPLYSAVARIESRLSLPEALRPCIPLRRDEKCWPRVMTTMLDSCRGCCDPRYPRGKTMCFQAPWTFELCCSPDDLEAGWSPPRDKIEELAHPNVAGPRVELHQLRRDLRQGSDRNRQPKQAGSERAAAMRDLEVWLKRAEAQLGGQQRIFPELDLLVSTKACLGPEFEMPWFLVNANGEGLPSFEEAPSGLELAVAFGAVCGAGVPVAGEEVSRSGRRVTMPSEEVRADPELHRLEPYGLELMRPCNFTHDSCPCGGPWCDDGQSCCHTGLEQVKWRKLGLLTGELRTNIAHYARDALWLNRLLSDDGTLHALGALRGEHDEGKTDVVLTKHAAVECVENGQCVKTGREAIYDMELFLGTVAFRDSLIKTAVFNAGNPDLNHPVCFEVVAQRWRPWAGDGHSTQAFRKKAMDMCGVVDRGIRRKIVILRRDSASRQWRNEEAMNRDLSVLARSLAVSLYSVSLGELDPCEQVAVLHDAMLVIGAHGADLTNMIFLPAGAAVVEIAVECEVDGGSIDFPFWRGPGTFVNASVYKEALIAWRRQSAEGRCPAAGAFKDDWLQGFPISQFAKLARQANLLYTAVMDCSEVNCTRASGRAGEVVDRGWCQSTSKKKRFVEVDVANHLLPTIGAILEEYLLPRVPAFSAATEPQDDYATRSHKKEMVQVTK